MDLTNKKYILIDNEKEISKEFNGLWTYIQDFYEHLWNNPYIIYKIISNASKDDIKNNLANFFMHNFYDCILSENYIEDNLMYIIYLLLKEEIDKITDANHFETFLKNSPCGLFLEQLCEKIDIKSFIKLNVLNVLENLNWTFASKRMIFDIENIQKNLTIIKEELKRNNNKKKNKNEFSKRKSIEILEDNDNTVLRSCLTEISTISSLPNEKEFLKEKKCEEDNDIFNKKYMPDVSYAIKNIKNQNLETDEKSKIIKEYIKYQIEVSKSMNNKKYLEIYSNESFVGNLYNCPIPDEVLSIYITSFLKATETINSLFKNLLSNLNLVPNSIKSLCKIISILIKNKFPNINKIQQNSFIAKFFFNKLLFPIFENPLHKALINEYIITGETINNIKIVIDIIENLSSGKFYTQNKENGNFTPFNNYFLEIMPDLYKFIDFISEGNLSPFMENIINLDKVDNNNSDNDKLKREFEGDYFNKHPNDIMYLRTIFLSFDDFYVLIQNINKSKDKLFINENTKILEIIFNKINKSNNIALLEKIKKNKEYENISIISKNKSKKTKKDEQKIEIKKYFLFNKLIVNEKYSYILDLNLEEKPYLSLKELEKNETKEEIEKNNIIKVKNIISSILYNYQTLKYFNIKKDENMDSLKIFQELKKYIKLSDFNVNKNFPVEWHLNSLLEYLKKIPENLAENDFKMLYQQIEKDINDSIEYLNFDKLGSLLDKIKLSQRIKNFNIQAQKKIADIYLNEKVQYIIEYTQIPVEFYYNYKEKEKKMNVKEMKRQDKSLYFLDSFIFKEPPKGTKICNTIKSFIDHFPNIIKNELFLKENQKLFEMLKQLKISKTMINYINIVKKKLHNLEIWSNEEEFNNIINKIYDYVTEKIYDKIYPKIPSINDAIIYNNCLKLGWTEPKHYIKNKKKYIFDSFLPDIIFDFNQIDKNKSPRLKISYIKDIFKCINKVEEFSGEDVNNIGIDDQIPILVYAFIKSQPNNIETNCNFIDLFIEQDGEEDNLLMQIRVICKYVLEINYSNLNDVSKEEYDSKMINYEKEYL